MVGDRTWRAGACCCCWWETGVVRYSFELKSPWKNYWGQKSPNLCLCLCIYIYICIYVCMYVCICMYIFLILTRFLAHGMQKACKRQGRVLRWAEMSNEMSYLTVSEATIEPHRPAPRPRLCEAFVDGDIHDAWTSKASGRERAYTTGTLHLMELGGNSECCSTIGSLLPIPLFLARLPAILSAIFLFRSARRSFQALKWNFENISEYGNFFPNISQEFRISFEIPGIVLRDMVFFLQGYGQNTNNTAIRSIFPIFFF